MRQILALAVIALVSCEESELHRVCPDSCYSGAPGTVGVGLCRAGTPVCDSNADVISCDGEVTPQAETCNGLDDDCDDYVDEGSFTVSPGSTGNPCLQYGPCSMTWYMCIDGAMTCDYAVPPTEEVCDGIDNNCDGQTDNDLNGPPFEFCYSGEDEETALHGVCHPGIVQCLNGTEVCFGERTPAGADSCEEDRNCDGIVTPPGNDEAVDIVFAIDTSGSMVGRIATVASAICSFSGGGNSDFRFALVLVATPDSSFSLAMDFGTSQDLCWALQAIEVQGSEEPTLDANKTVCDSASPSWSWLSWRPGAQKAFIGFADEDAQAIGCADTACLDQKATDVIDSCRANGVSVYWFSATVSYYLPMASSTGGTMFNINSSNFDMISGMNSIFSDFCAE